MDHRVLIVDDEATMRMVLTEALNGRGFLTATAQNGEEALQVLDQGVFHLVVSDVRMPEMDGMNLLRRLQRERSELPVIIITAFGTVDIAVEAMKNGAIDFIQKPFSLEEFVNLVERVFQRLTQSPNQQTQRQGKSSNQLVAENKKMLALIELARSVAPSQASVLIQGESGTGKELFARLIHESSDRNNGPFVAVNCAAIPENLLESELFGHEKGAFTGAVYQRIGKFEQANHGTLLLDEISEMDMTLQAKLLRVLQEHELDRVGGKKPIPLDVRVIGTTNRDIKQEIEAGRFRQDLYYRLNVIPIKLPALRERPDDVLPLAYHFIQRAAERNRKAVNGLTPDAEEYLKSREWEGNARELENTIERAVLVAQGGKVDRNALVMFEETQPSTITSTGQVSAAGMTMREMEKQLIAETLDSVNGNRTHAAKMLGISIRTLRNKLNEYRATGELMDM